MIGVFDSGLGGLTVLKEFLRVLPDYNYVYLGDNARAPYGDKTDEEIYKYSKWAVEFLFKQGCRLVIIACHTVSAKALRKIQREYLPAVWPDRRVLGVAVPMVEQAVGLAGRKLGIIGTRATIDSGVYKKELEKLKNDLEIYQQACPLLAPLVEEGWVGQPAARAILEKYLRPLQEKQIDILLLGCTHYPLLEKDILKIMGERVKVIDPALAVAEKLKDYLIRHQEIEKELEKSRQAVFYTTGDKEKFKKLGEGFLGREINTVSLAVLNKG